MNATVLVTGFEAFGGHEHNPTEALVRTLAGAAVPGVQVCKAVLPVSYEHGLASLLKVVSEAHPRAVVCCGLHANATAIAVERVGLNVQDRGHGEGLADNDGALPRDEPVVPGGPDGLFTTLPNRAILNALHARGIPAVMSSSAGTFVCNTVLYGLLHRLQQQDTQPPAAGFLHFPRTADLAVADPGAPSMSFSMMREALVIALETVVAHLPGS